jgi:hypothetical protein
MWVLEWAAWGISMAVSGFCWWAGASTWETAKALLAAFLGWVAAVGFTVSCIYLAKRWGSPRQVIAKAWRRSWHW